MIVFPPLSPLYDAVNTPPALDRLGSARFRRKNSLAKAAVRSSAPRYVAQYSCTSPADGRVNKKSTKVRSLLPVRCCICCSAHALNSSARALALDFLPPCCCPPEAAVAVPALVRAGCGVTGAMTAALRGAAAVVVPELVRLIGAVIGPRAWFAARPGEPPPAEGTPAAAAAAHPLLGADTGGWGIMPGEPGMCPPVSGASHTPP